MVLYILSQAGLWVENELMLGDKLELTNANTHYDWYAGSLVLWYSGIVITAAKKKVNYNKSASLLLFFL